MRFGKQLLPLMGLVLVACVASTDGRYRGRTVAVVSTPEMVPIGANVWVMEDYYAPTFYSDGYYWQYDNGGWYRYNRLYDQPVRVRVSTVPSNVRRIDRPTYYIHYRAPQGTVRRVPPGHQRGYRYRHY